MRYWKNIGALILLLAEGVLQLSGYQNPTLAVVLGLVMVSLLLWSAWPTLKRIRLQKPIKLDSLNQVPIVDNTKNAEKPSVLMPITRYTAPVEQKLTPEFLIGLYAGRTTAQGDILAKSYIGREIRITGSINDINRQGDQVKITLKITPKPLPLVFAYFSEGWFEQISAHNKDESVTVTGNVEVVDGLGWVRLTNCRIIY